MGMTWIGWLVVTWAALMVGGFGLIGFWLAQAMHAQDRRELAAATAPRPLRPVVPGQSPLADLMADEFSLRQARAVPRTDTQTYLAASAVSGELLAAPARGPRHVSTETVGIPVIDVLA